MKKTLTILTMLLLATAPSSIAQKSKKTAATSSVVQPDNLIVPGQRIGSIRIGMGMDEVEALLGKPTYSTHPPAGLGVSWNYNQLNLYINFTAEAAPSVTSISTLAYTRKNNKTLGTTAWKDLEPLKLSFQTSNGIAIGSTSFDVKRAYSAYTAAASESVLMNYPSNGISFIITTDHRVYNIIVFRPQ